MDVHFNGYKVKFDQLTQYLSPILRTHPIKSINFFINLDDLFHTLHTPLINSEFQVCGRDAPKQMLSNIFNLLGHYRYWGIKNNLEIKVFGIYTSTIRSFKNNIYNPEYRKEFKRLNGDENAGYFFINNAITTAQPIMPIVSKFIPGVYIIDSKYIEPSVIPLYIAEELVSASWNVLISRDPYDLQYTYRTKWTLISPKGENTRCVDKDGIWKYIAFKEKVFKKDKDADEKEALLDYPYDMFILAKAITGDRYRSVPRLRKVGWKTLFKYMDDLMDENPDATDTTLKIKLVEKIKDKTTLTNATFNDNLNCVDIDMQKKAMLTIDKALIKDQLIDVADLENLQELNRTQFTQYPLNIQFLCNTSPIIRKTPFD